LAKGERLFFPLPQVTVADYDGDGDPDTYVTRYGRNTLWRNDHGRFADVTEQAGVGCSLWSLGAAFLDYDRDGDLDLFVELGGATPGDQASNALFKNPGHGRHWLKVKLVGTKTNRAALGSRIQVDRKAADNSTISIYRTVGNNSSFGGNSLVETFGRLDATRVTQLTVSWPTSKTTQTIRDLKVDQAIEITEGSDTFKKEFVDFLFTA
jgi:hypothetical protein